MAGREGKEKEGRRRKLQKGREEEGLKWWQECSRIEERGRRRSKGREKWEEKGKDRKGGGEGKKKTERKGRW